MLDITIEPNPTEWGLPLTRTSIWQWEVCTYTLLDAYIVGKVGK